MEKRSQSVETMIRLWVLKEEMHQREVSQEKFLHPVPREAPYVNAGRDVLCNPRSVTPAATVVKTWYGVHKSPSVPPFGHELTNEKEDTKQ